MSVNYAAGEATPYWNENHGAISVCIRTYSLIECERYDTLKFV